MKDLILNLALLGVLLPLFHSLPVAAQLMVDSAAGFDEIPSAQSSIRKAVNDARISSLSSGDPVKASMLDPD